MPANLENSAVATGLEKVSFYSNPKLAAHTERGKCEKIFLNLGIKGIYSQYIARRKNRRLQIVACIVHICKIYIIFLF